MKKASGISSAAIQALIAEIKPGCSERDIALRLEIIARQSGADHLAFDAIIASGENSSLPHARPPIGPSGKVISLLLISCHI